MKNEELMSYIIKIMNERECLCYQLEINAETLNIKILGYKESEVDTTITLIDEIYPVNIVNYIYIKEHFDYFKENEFLVIGSDYFTSEGAELIKIMNVKQNKDRFINMRIEICGNDYRGLYFTISERNGKRFKKNNSRILFVEEYANPDNTNFIDALIYGLENFCYSITPSKLTKLLIYIDKMYNEYFDIVVEKFRKSIKNINEIVKEVKFNSI